jgi:YebC/PmpR family DNA-binding regulatory protein
MSGHSKWSTIKHKKGAADAKRGKLFTKLIKELTVASREGGGEEAANPRLRSAVQNAKAANMPNATIERAIKRGTGEEDGVVYEEGLFEGYGPGGVAVMVETLTDNRNRTVAEVRHIFSKNNGNLAEKGAVGWMFDRRGMVEVAKDGVDEEELMLAVMDAGAEDIQDGGDIHEVVTSVESLEDVKKALQENEITAGQTALVWMPQNLLEVEGNEIEQIIRLLEGLEDLDDVQKVFSNFDVNEEELEKILA